MTDFSSVKNKVAIITGGADGIGKSIAQIYAENGMKVVIADLNDKKGEATELELTNGGYDVKFFHADASIDNDMKSLIDFTICKYGKLHGIVNNAGIGISKKSIAEYTPDEYDKAMSIDQKSVFLGMHYAINAINESCTKSGFVINIASLAGITGNSGLGIYTAAKHAVVGMTKCAALDYAESSITINCICPGTIETSIWRNAPDSMMQKYASMFSPSCRLGKPEEIAYLALFLASDMARYITGAVIPIDGGSSAGRVTKLPK